ncbi:hypothetical protein ACROYT_G011404 [Oculina patagonica]
MATNMAGRFVAKILQRSAGPVNETVTDLKRCVIQGLRFCSSTPGSRNKILEAESDGDNINEPKHVARAVRQERASIRKFCETVSKPNDVPQLFNQFLRLPKQYQIESVDCALYWLSYYDKIDGAFELKTLMEKHDISKSYSTYSVLASLYSKSNHTRNYQAMFDEMKRDGLTPQARHFAPFVETATQNGDLMGAFRCLDDMRQAGVVRERNTDIYTALVRACIGQNSRQLRNKVLEIFYEFRNYRDLLSNDTLEVIKMWFDSQIWPKWTTSWSTPSVTFHCQACKQKLETGEYSEEELHELKYPLVTHLWKDRKEMSQVRCFTSSGNYVDHIRAGHHKFPDSVVHFIETTGRYDVVLDSLNIAYFSGSFDPEKVKIVASHFLKQNKKVLVVGSKPISLSKRKKQGAHTKLASVMDLLSEHCGVFCLAESSLDDVYFLSAAMHCGPGTMLVSNDMFFDHIHDMDVLMKAQFKRWQQLYQLKLERFVYDNPVFASVKNFDTAVHVQTTGDTWHFPSSDGSRWLCIKKKGIF